MIDSTDPAVVEIALKNLAGRAVVNSINLEDGGKKAKIIINLCKNYGAAVVALVIGKKMPFSDMIPYILSQVAGGLVALELYKKVKL